VLSRQPKRWGRAHRRKALGRQDDPVAIAARFHPAPDDRFGGADRLDRAAERIRICGVEECQATLERGVGISTLRGSST